MYHNRACSTWNIDGLVSVAASGPAIGGDLSVKSFIIKYLQRFQGGAKLVGFRGPRGEDLETDPKPEQASHQHDASDHNVALDPRADKN